MKKILIVATLTLFGLSFLGISTAIAGECMERSQGYWKNHPEKWGVGEITVGFQPYNVADAIELMKTPVKGDKWLTLFKQTVAATLNVQHGCPPPPVPPEICANLTLCWDGNPPDIAIPEQICAPLDQANLWLSAFGGNNRPVAASTDPWQNSHGEDTYTCLDAYNNGAF